MKEAPHPQERSPLGRAGPSATLLTGPLIMLEFGMCVEQWFVRKTCASF